jgi:hypothetical protein
MTKNGIGEKERLQVLLTEYTSLRSEINVRMSSVYQVAWITAAVTIYLLQQEEDGGIPLILGFVAGLIGLLICAWTLARDLVRAALRVKQIEFEVNRRAGEQLLVWETEWGGQTSRLWGARTFRKILLLDRPPYSNRPTARLMKPRR